MRWGPRRRLNVGNGTNGKAGNTINIGAALKVAATTVVIAGACIGAVVYLEHKFQALGEDISALKADVRHLQANFDTLATNVDENRDEYTNALRALQENQYQIALKLAECCPAGKKGVDVAASAPPSILPYNLAFEGNPGIVIEQKASKGKPIVAKDAAKAHDLFSEPRASVLVLPPL